MVPIANQPASEATSIPYQSRSVDRESRDSGPGVDLDELPCGIVGIASKDKTPRETSAQLELHSGIVQDSRARRTDVRSEDGIIEPSSRVVGIDVEVVMVGKIRLGGLEPEGLSCVCVSGGDGVGGDNDGSEEERESREKLHFDYCCGYCLLFFFFSGR